MELNIKKSKVQKIQVGDVVITESGKTCLLIKNESLDSYFPYSFVNLEGFFTENIFSDLDAINKERYIRAGDKIVDVIKSSELELNLI